MKPFDRSAHGRAHALKRKPWLAALAAYTPERRRRFGNWVLERRPRLIHGWWGVEGEHSREALRLARELVLFLDESTQDNGH